MAIDELVAPPGADAETRARCDRPHRLLDPSHATALSGDELLATCRAQIGQASEHTLNDPAVLLLDLIVTDASDRPVPRRRCTTSSPGDRPPGSHRCWSTAPSTCASPR